MSDSEDGRDDGKRAKGGPVAGGGPTPRASLRACDSCRAKKIKCDGPSMDNRICTNCRQYGLDCQYVQQAKKRGPPKGYIESVETRLARIENLLNRLAPGADFTPELGARIDKENFDLATHRQSEPTGNAHVTSPVSAGGGGPGPSSRTSSLNAADQPSQACSSTEAIRPWLEDGNERAAGDSAEEDQEEAALLQAMEKVQLAHPDEEQVPLGFSGKSSSFNLLLSARDYKYGTVGAPDNFIEGLFSSRRPFFWKMPPWENSRLISEHPMTWPPEDLVPQLVDEYFHLYHHACPLLHEPTFRRDLAGRVYERDKDFRHLCLTVFALSSRSCSDERMYMPRNILPADTPEPYRRYSAGWQLIGQIMSEPFDWNAPPNLYELQSMVLLTSFLQGGSHPRIGWTLIGVALRNCIDLGLHREHVLKSKPKAEAELWRRTFWSLYALDRTTAGIMGRPLAIHDEDIDIDYPLDVDDEYWETGTPARDFVQPEGTPSKMSGFIASLKLMQINGYCLRTVYCINKAKLMLRFNSIEAQQQVVAELDSALNSWLDNIPAHLKWNPHNKDEIFMQQSALLYSAYYATQILVHRPFIPTSSRPSKVAFPSLAICTNAARSGAHVVETARHRPRFQGYEISTALQAWTFGIVLLINIWGGKKSGSIGDPAMARADVDKLNAFFTKLEQRWFVGGRVGDVLRELASQGGMPSPDPANVVPPSHKRPRGSTAPSSASASAAAPPPAQSFGLSAAPAPPTSGTTRQRKPAGSISKRASADFSHAQALFHQAGQHSPITHASPAASVQESTASSSGFPDPAIDADIVSHRHLPTLPRSAGDGSLGFFGQAIVESNGQQQQQQQQQQPGSAAAVIDPAHFAAFLAAQAAVAGGPAAVPPAFSSGFPPGGANLGFPPAGASGPSPQTASGFPDWMNTASAGASWPQPPPPTSAASTAANGEATMDLLFANGTFPMFSPPGDHGVSLFGNGALGTPGLNGAPNDQFPNTTTGPASIGLWDNAPANFEMDDWSSYLSQFGPSDANGR